MLQINTFQKHGTWIVKLSGRFDAHTAPALGKILNRDPERAPETLVVDLDGVSFIDSSGLALLVRADRVCREQNRRFYLRNLRQPVRIIFELTRLDAFFEIRNEIPEPIPGGAR